MIRVAINGFGRIGRVTLRSALARKNYGSDFEIVALNDLMGSELSAHLFKWDTTYRKYGGEVIPLQNGIEIDGKEIRLYNERDPSSLPWKDLGIDLTIESTGIFRDRQGASKHLEAGAKKVLISAPARDPDITILLGVNEETYDRDKHNIISNASCTTNSLAPPVKVLNDEFGIISGFMTTVHAYTLDQMTLDGMHKDYRRARTAAANTIPTTTGAAKAVGEVLPELKGRLNGIALRVPVPDGSITDFVAHVEKETTAEEVNETLKKAAEGRLKGIMRYSEEPIVSSDIIGDPHSAVIDSPLTMALGKMVKIFSWYDNEWGYSNRLVDLITILT
jgi:glyceraldehyde 3-phosphate dehydrogenase